MLFVGVVIVCRVRFFRVFICVSGWFFFIWLFIDISICLIVFGQWVVIWYSLFGFVLIWLVIWCVCFRVCLLVILVLRLEVFVRCLGIRVWFLWFLKCYWCVLLFRLVFMVILKECGLVIGCWFSKQLCFGVKVIWFCCLFRWFSLMVKFI